jgi:thiamine biosynthesis lipoprotein ApbE
MTPSALATVGQPRPLAVPGPTGPAWELDAHGLGAHGQVVAVGTDAAEVAAACSGLADLDRLWSPDGERSEVRALNARPGVVRPVTAETVLLVRLALRAEHETAGMYRAALDARPGAPTRSAASAVPGPRRPPDYVVDVRHGRVGVAPGGRFSPGHLARGLALDLLVEDLLQRGATAACAVLGGDVRMAGTAPWPQGWSAAVPAPQVTGPPLPRHGAIATVRSTLAAVGTVTVVSDEAWRACALAQAEVVRRSAGVPPARGAGAISG